jgi:hypothetical protein
VPAYCPPCLGVDDIMKIVSEPENIKPIVQTIRGSTLPLLVKVEEEMNTDIIQTYSSMNALLARLYKRTLDLISLVLNHAHRNTARAYMMKALLRVFVSIHILVGNP